MTHGRRNRRARDDDVRGRGRNGAIAVAVSNASGRVFLRRRNRRDDWAMRFGRKPVILPHTVPVAFQVMSMLPSARE